MKDKKLVIYISIVMIVIMLVVLSFSYAYLAANQNIVNNLNVNVTFANGTVANFTVTGNTNMTLNINGGNMLIGGENSVAADESKNIVVRLQSDINVTCSYSIIWNWLSGSDTYEKSFTDQNEFVVYGSTGSGLSLGEINVPYSIENSMVLGRYTISANATTTTQTWNIGTKFYNLDVNQDYHADKTYRGQIAIDDAHCYPTGTTTLANKIISNTANASTNAGTDAQGNNWLLTTVTHSSDSKTDYRYAGANPPNFVEFNGEMWRIIGVMPVDYDTNGDGVPETNGNLVKIIRSTTYGSTYIIDGKAKNIGSSGNTSGSNVWSDSQLMLMTNPSTFYTSSYTVSGTVPQISVIRNGYVQDANGVNFYRNPASLWNTGTYTVYKPASANLTNGFNSTTAFTKCSGSTVNDCFKPFSLSAQGMVATVKWNLGGISSIANTVETIYQREKSNYTCATITSNTACTQGTNSLIRPTYWYGKVGLMYPSDYGYSGGGSNDGTTYPRSSCLSANLNASGNYRTYCGLMSYLTYKNATASSKGTAINGVTLTNYSSRTEYITQVSSSGFVTSGYAYSSYNTRPALYLNADTVVIDGDGSYNNPYRLL